MKNQDSILIFGSSGQIGKSLIRKFTKNNYRVTAVTRSIHQKGYQIKTQSNYGYLELEEIKSFTEENISRLMKNNNVCINLIGILYEKKKNFLIRIHQHFPLWYLKFTERHLFIYVLISQVLGREPHTIRIMFILNL